MRKTISWDVDQQGNNLREQIARRADNITRAVGGPPSNVTGTPAPETRCKPCCGGLITEPCDFCSIDNFDRDVGTWRDDTFSRVTTSGSGWGDAEFDSLSYISSANAGFTDGSIAVLDHTGTTNRLNFPADLTNTGGVTGILVKMRLPSNGDVAVGYTNSATSLSVGGSSQCFFTLSLSGTTLTFRSKRNGSATQVSKTFPTSYSNQWLWVRYSVFGTTINTKVWLDGDLEPSQADSNYNIAHATTVFDIRNIIFQNGVVTGNRGEFDYWEQWADEWTITPRTVNWGSGSLGQWESISEALELNDFGSDNDEAVYVEDGHGVMTYGGLDNPAQILTFPSGLNYPIEITWEAYWSNPRSEDNWLFYIGPYHHFDINAWYSFSGFYDDSPEGPFIDLSANGEAGYDLDTAIDFAHPDTIDFTEFSPPGDYLVDATYRWRILLDSDGIFSRLWPTTIDEPTEWSTAHYWDDGPPPHEWLRKYYFETQASGEKFHVNWFQICSPTLTGTGAGDCEQEILDRDGEVLGTVTNSAEAIPDTVTPGLVILGKCVRQSSTVYNTPSPAAQIMSVYLDSLPTLDYTFNEPMTTTFNTSVAEGTEVWVRYVSV